MVDGLVVVALVVEVVKGTNVVVVHLVVVVVGVSVVVGGSWKTSFSVV